MVNLHITKTDPLPIHAQLMEQLKYHIEVGSWSPGTQLPTLRKIADLLRINYNTARLAYRELEQQGYIVTKQGRGTFVASDPPRLPEDREEKLVDIIDEALAKAQALGIGHDAFARRVSARAKLHLPEATSIRLLFTECNRFDLDYYAGRIEENTGVQPESFLLTELGARTPDFFQSFDLITTTLFHVAETQALIGPERTALGLMIKPSYLNMISEIARYPEGQCVGLIGGNEGDAENMKRALLGAGTRHLEFLTAGVDQPDRLAGLTEQADYLYASRYAIRAHGDPWPGGKPVHKYEEDLDDAALRMLRRQIARLRTDRLEDEAASALIKAPS